MRMDLGERKDRKRVFFREEWRGSLRREVRGGRRE